MAIDGDRRQNRIQRPEDPQCEVCIEEKMVGVERILGELIGVCQTCRTVLSKEKSVSPYWVRYRWAKGVSERFANRDWVKSVDCNVLEIPLFAVIYWVIAAWLWKGPVAGIITLVVLLTIIVAAKYRAGIKKGGLWIRKSKLCEDGNWFVVLVGVVGFLGFAAMCYNGK